MFSRTVEYALRAIVFLANQSDDQNVRQIAEATKVKKPYLAKVLHQLARHQLIRSKRGKQGGFSLVKLPSELTIWDVVQAIEPIRRIRHCPLELDAHRTKLCSLHKKLDEALEQIEIVFTSTTIAEILQDPNPSKPLCPFPQVLNMDRPGRIALT